MADRETEGHSLTDISGSADELMRRAKPRIRKDGRVAEDKMTEENRSQKKSKKAKIFFAAFLVCGLLTVICGLIIAATGTWPFSAVTEVTLSNFQAIEVSGGKLQLKTYKPYFLHDSKSEFDTGTYSDTEFLTADAGQNQSSIITSQSGMVSYWPLNGSAGAIANGATSGLTDSKSAYNGTASNTNGTGMVFTSGKFGNGVDFDGVDDYINVPYNAALNLTSSGTVSAWVKFDTIPGAAIYAFVNFKRASSNTFSGPAYALGIKGLGGSAVKVTGRINGPTGSPLEVVGATTLSTGTWYHLAFTFDGTAMRVYVNGVSDGLAAQTASPVYLENLETRIGGGSQGSDIPWDGMMDDVVIYNTALTADQIQAQAAAGARVHMKASASLTPHAPKLTAGYAGLVAYWPMDNSSGTALPDLQGYSKGTLTNGAVFAAAINGNGITFDGVDDFVDMGERAVLKLKSAMTVSAWIKLNSDYTSPQAIAVVSTPAAGDDQTPFAFTYSYNTDGKINVWDDTPGYGPTNVTSTTAITNNNWHHVAATRSGSAGNWTVKIYIDGVLDKTQAVTTNPGATLSGAAFAIGRYGGYVNGWKFKGTIDEMAIFNRALSDGEIAYLAGKKGETATYTSPVMNGEISGATWDKITADYVGLSPSLGTNIFSPIATNVTYSAGGDVADFNGDGALDMVACDGYNLIKLINDGSGNMTKTNFVNTGNSSSSNNRCIAGDFNKDNITDIAALTVNGVVWYQSNGAADPSFSPERSLQGGSPTAWGEATDIASGDLDGDGDRDVVVSFAGSTNKLSWFDNSGGNPPTWAENVITGTSGTAWKKVKVKDINGDGNLDLIVISGTNTLVWFKNSGGASPTFSPTTVTSSFTAATDINAGDLDNDGDLDIAATAAWNTSKLSWFVNDGSATPAFATQNVIVASTNTLDLQSVIPVDFDRDGDMDLIAASGANAGRGTYFYSNNGSQVFTPATTLQTAYVTTYPGGLSVADFNGDGQLDFTANGMYLFLRTPFQKNSRVNMGGVWTLFSHAIDMDGDGDLDVLRAGTNYALEWYENDGAGVFTARTISSSNTYRAANAGDLDGDGDIDVVARNTSPQTLDWFRNDGGSPPTFTKIEIANGYTYDYPQRIMIEDMNSDGSRDILFWSGDDSKLHLWLNDGQASPTFTVTKYSNTGGPLFAEPADVNGDGYLDLVSTVGNCCDGYLNFLKNDGAATPGFTITDVGHHAETSSSYAAIVDLDRDGDLDILRGPTGASAELRFYANSGGTSPTFAAAQTLLTSPQFTWCQIGSNGAFSDIDGDGDLDMIMSCSSGLVMFENLNNGVGTSWAKTVIDVPGTTNWTELAADFNRDGLLDVLNPEGNGAGLLYKQIAASTVRIRVRTGATDPPASTFVGPNNTAVTFNGSVPSTGAGHDGAGINSNLDSKQYAQYQAIFYRNDTSIDPMIKNVRIDYTSTAYSKLNPYATNASPIPFTHLTSFTSTGETKPAGSDIKYQLSPDGGTTWKYFSGSWATSDGTFAQSSTAATINSNIATFDDSLSATGSLLWKAVLNSDGTVQPSLDQVDVGYENASLTVTAPNGGELWRVGDANLISWTTSGGTVPSDLTLEYNNTGSTSIFGSSIDTNVDSTHHNEEKMSGAYAVWHFGTDTSTAIADNTSPAGLADSMGSFNLTSSNVNGSGLSFATGKFGGGVTFDGVDDYLKRADGTNLSAYSYSAWVKFNAASGIVIQKSDFAVNYNRKILVSGGKFQAFAYSSPNSYTVTGTTNISTGTWYHVASTMSNVTNGTMRLYVNGVEEGTPVVVPSNQNTTNYQIGSGVNGTIDEVAIFNRALTSSEIAALAGTNPGYVWSTPSENSSQIRVRVRSASTPLITDIGNANSSISNLTLTAPNTGNEVWAYNSSQNVTWTAGNVVPSDLALQYSSDSGVTWSSNITTGLTPAGGTYAWTIPDLNKSTMRVKIYSASKTNFYDVSDNNFTISGGTLNTRTWDNGSGDGKWSTAANWTNDTLPVAGNDVVFNATSNTAVTADIVPQNLKSISLNAGYTNTVTFSKNAVAAGMTLTLTGDLTVNAGTLAFDGDTSVDSIAGNDPIQGSNVADGTGYTVNAANVTVGASGTISVNGKGYSNAAGPGASGSYGGMNMRSNIAKRYGSVTQPTSLGSGGSDTGSIGGGALKLNVTSTTIADGLITAAGLSNSICNTSIGASGGSLWIITNSLAGAGTISAKGGNADNQNCGGTEFGGGGGRISISYTTSTFSGNYSAAGGTSFHGTGLSGMPGTLNLPWGQITDFTVNNGIALASGTYTFNNLTVTNNATLWLQPDPNTDSIAGGANDGSGVIINAANVTVNAGSKISADSAGFGLSSGPGFTASHAGSYGGLGYNQTNTVGKTYGSLTQPLSLGSGASSLNANMGAAGGAVKLNVSGTLTVNGDVTADGRINDNSCGNSLGDSGGSVWLIADTLAGSGTIKANGYGTDGPGCGGASYGGGGGRVSLDWGTASTFSGNIYADGGIDSTGQNANGSNGTIAYLEVSSPNGGEVWKNSKAHAINWLSGRDVPNDLTLEYSTAGSDFSAPVSIDTNVNSQHHNEEKMSGAVAVWHFGTATSGNIATGATFADSKGTNTGTASNVNTTGMAYTAGKFSGGVDFDGTDDYIEVPHAAGLIPATVTVSAWVKPNGAPSNGTFIVSKEDTNSQSLSYGLVALDGTLAAPSFFINGSASGAGAGAATTLSGGNWYHIAGTYDGAFMRIYINGVLSGIKAHTGTIGNSRPLRIGRAGGASNGFFKGVIDEVSVFNRALSDAEIAALASTNPGYVWTAPNVESNTVRVRARSVSEPNLTDISNANFTITDMNITAPNGGEYLAIGGTKNITWSAGANANFSDYVLEYTTMATDPLTSGADPLTTWVQIAAAQTGAGGTYSWSNIPDTASATARVRIRSVANTDLVDVSNANFNIAGLAITQPNGANVIYEGEKYDITWGHGGTNLSDFILEYDTGGGYTAFNPAANALSASRGDSASLTAGFNPASIANAVGVWRFNEGSGTSAADSSSSGTYTGTLTGNPAWSGGQFGNGLTMDGVDDVVTVSHSAALNAYPMSAGAWIKTANSSASFGGIIMKYAGGTGYALYHHGANVRAMYYGSAGSVPQAMDGGAISDGVWHYVMMTIDASGGKLYVDGRQKDKKNWTNTPSAATTTQNLTIGDYPGGGNHFTGQIDEAVVFSRALTAAEIRTLAGGSYQWTVPDTPSTTTKVRVRSSSATDLTDASDANFEIRARSLVLNAPNGGGSYQEASIQNIQWTSAGLVSNNVTLDYNKNNGAYTTIATGVDAGGKPFERSVGAWGFGEGTGQTVADKSPAGNNGTLGANSSAGSDDPIFVLGKFGHALQFDGVDDYVQMADLANGSGYDFNAGGSFTLSAWINPSDLNGGRTILYKDNGGTGPSYSMGLELFAASGKIELNKTDGSSDVVSTGAVTAGQWNHVAAVKTGTTVNFYINGVAAGSGSWDNAAPGTGGFYIGQKASFLSSKYFKGGIDEVQIYNRALTATEITALSSGMANYPWKVPDDESTQVKVRVTDANRPATTDNSNAFFSITPRTVNVFAPNGGETFPYATVQYLNWDPTGPLSNNLTLDLSVDGGSSYNVPNRIATGVDAGGAPLSGAQGAWGMGEGSGTTIADKSGNANTGTLNLGTGGNTVNADAWKVGKFGYGMDFDGIDDYVSVTNAMNPVKSIAFWIKADVTASKKILNIDGTAQIELNGSSAVTATSFPSATVYVDGVAGATIDTSWHHVVITDSTGVNATTFQMGRVGSGYFDGMLDEVQVYNRVLTAAEIAQLSSGKAVYPWTVPDPGFNSGTRKFNSRVKVTDSGRPATNDASNANFNLVTPRFTITAPPPPAAVPFGQAQNITWTHDNTTQGSPVSTDLKLEFSLDDGATYPGGSQVIIADSSSNGGPVTSPFNWGVPAGAVSSTVKIRIQDNVYPYGESESTTFKVTGSIAVIKPNGGEKWAVGFPHDITWQRQGNFSNVKIYTHNGDGTPITTIVNSTSASAGLYTWTPAAGEAGTGLKIRIEDAADSDVYDDSNATFSVTKVVVGNPAARLQADASWTITWTHTGLTNVKLEYSLLGDFSDAVTIVGSTSAAAGTYNAGGALKVPKNTTTTFKVRASDPDVPGVGDAALAVDASDSPSTVYGLLALVQPNGGETIPAGQPYDITWTSSPADVNVIPQVLITAARDGNFNNNTGGNIVTIAASAPNHNNPGAGNGKFTWIPTFTSTLAKIRIADANDPNATNAQNRDDSNGFFTVSGIALTSPAGGETALVNGSMGITFGFTGGITRADFYYSPTGASTACGGAGWTLIQSNFNVPTNPYTYNWTPVPNQVSTVAKVCVRDYDLPATYASSPAFNIKNVLNITTPGTLYVGDAYTIQWSNTGTASDVKLEYSKLGDFSDAVTIATPTGLSGGQTSTNQTYNWTVPDAIATTVKLRVTDQTSHPNGSVASSAATGAFSIGAKINITAPTGASIWGVNESMRDITWSTTGTLSNVKLEYLAENDAYASAGTISNSTSNDGTHTWNSIPDIVTLRGQDPQVDRDILVKVRICDADAGHPSACVTSSAFTVKWYQVTWAVRDADSASHLGSLNVTEVDGGNNTTWTVNDNSLNSATIIRRNYQYANYTTSWSKVGYTGSSIDGWLADSDKTNTVFLLNEATANVEQRVQFNYAYNETTKQLTMRTWLERMSRLQTGVNLLGTSTLKVYDGATLISTLTDNVPDNGFYNFALDNTGGTLVSGKVYTVSAEILFNNAPLDTGHTVVLTDYAKISAIDTKLGDLADTAANNTLFGKLAGVADTANTINTTTGAMSTAVSAIDSKVDTVSTNVSAVDSKLGSLSDAAGANSVVGILKDVQSKQGDVSIIEANTVTLLDEVRNKLPTRLDNAGAGNKGGRGQLIKRNTKFSIGQTATVRFQFDAGATPTLDVYGPDNKILLAAQPMTEVADGKGIYGYDLKLLSSYKKGDYTVIVTESGSGFMDSMVLSVLPAGSSDEEMAQSASSASSFAQNASLDAKKAYEAALATQTSLGGLEGGGITKRMKDMNEMVDSVKKSLMVLTGGSQGDGGKIVTVSDVHQGVMQVMDQVKAMASEKGINMDVVYKSVAKQGQTTADIQNMVTAVQAISKSTQEMIEKAKDSPVMTSWFESAPS